MIVAKTLSANDVGETGSGQEGIAIPKTGKILNFFPILNKNVKNPRIDIKFTDTHGEEWFFGFVYYNNKFFGGTRNEYRLSKTRKYIKISCLKSGDRIILKNINGKRIISNSNEETEQKYKKNLITLSGEWYEYKVTN